jgi:hypothetical protein
MPKNATLLNDIEAANHIGVSAAFLRKGRCVGILGHATPPPPHLKIGRAVRYRISDLDAWLSARLIDPAQRRPLRHFGR